MLLSNDVCVCVRACFLSQGMQQHYRGQYDNAERTNKSARVWTICGIVSGVIYVVSIVFIIIVASVVRGVLTALYVANNPTTAPFTSWTLKLHQIMSLNMTCFFFVFFVVASLTRFLFLDIYLKMCIFYYIFVQVICIRTVFCEIFPFSLFM